MDELTRQQVEQMQGSDYFAYVVERSVQARLVDVWARWRWWIGLGVVLVGIVAGIKVTEYQHIVESAKARAQTLDSLYHELDQANSAMRRHYVELETQVPHLQDELRDSQNRSLALASTSYQFQSYLGSMAQVVTSETKQALNDVTKLKTESASLNGQFRHDADSTLHVLEGQVNESERLLTRASAYADTSGIRDSLRHVANAVADMRSQMSSGWSDALQQAEATATKRLEADIDQARKDAQGQLDKGKFLSQLKNLQQTVGGLDKRLGVVEHMARPAASTNRGAD